MPSSTALRFARGRPPLGRLGYWGRSGSIRSHKASGMRQSSAIRLVSIVVP